MIPFSGTEYLGLLLVFPLDNQCRSIGQVDVRDIGVRIAININETISLSTLAYKLLVRDSRTETRRKVSLY